MITLLLPVSQLPDGFLMCSSSCAASSRLAMSVSVYLSASLVALVLLSVEHFACSRLLFDSLISFCSRSLFSCDQSNEWLDRYIYIVDPMRHPAVLVVQEGVYDEKQIRDFELSTFLGDIVAEMTVKGHRYSSPRIINTTISPLALFPSSTISFALSDHGRFVVGFTSCTTSFSVQGSGTSRRRTP